MWSNGFSFTLQPERHWYLPVVVVGVTLAALFAIWLSRLPVACALSLAVIGCVQCGWALATGFPVIGISVDSSGQIRQGGAAIELQLAGPAWILPGIATGFRMTDGEGRVHSLIVLRRQLSADTWRRLLVRIQRN